MQEKLKSGLKSGMPCAFPVTGRIRAQDLMRRKLIRKILARRERHAAAIEPVLRSLP